jgi:hypothetical protein
MKQLHKFFVLPLPQKWLLCQSFLLLGLIRLALWKLSFQQLTNVLLKGSSKSQPLPSRGSIADTDIIWALEVATYYLPGQPKCLARALVAKLLLMHYGYRCDLRLGVARQNPEQLMAHAWVESEGKVLIGQIPELSSLTPFSNLHSLG